MGAPGLAIGYFVIALVLYWKTTFSVGQSRFPQDVLSGDSWLLEYFPGNPWSKGVSQPGKVPFPSSYHYRQDSM